MAEPLLSEEQILARLNDFFPDAALASGVLLGRGDDCAVVQHHSPICISTDLFMEDVHFRRAYFSPEDIGWKALAVNLSDLAGMGAKPVGFTASLGLPPDADMQLIEGLCRGMAELADIDSYNGLETIPLLGGDLSRAEKLHLSITVFGQAPRFLPRQKAEPGDLIFLVGEIGLAATGLQILESSFAAGKRKFHSDFPSAINAHLRPVPKLLEGMLLATMAVGLEEQTDGHIRLGLMDVSDGLARDLPRLLKKEQGAHITLSNPNPEILHFLLQSGQYTSFSLPAAASRQLYIGGEDYALLGTCEARFRDNLLHTLPEVILLGEVTDDGRFFCNDREYPRDYHAAFDHFAHN